MMFEPMTNGTEPTNGEVPGVAESQVQFISNGPIFIPGEIPVLRSADEIRKLLADVGVTTDKNVITY